MSFITYIISVILGSFLVSMLLFLVGFMRQNSQIQQSNVNFIPSSKMTLDDCWDAYYFEGKASVINDGKFVKFVIED